MELDVRDPIPPDSLKTILLCFNFQNTQYFNNTNIIPKLKKSHF